MGEPVYPVQAHGEPVGSRTGGWLGVEIVTNPRSTLRSEAPARRRLAGDNDTENDA
jgi:hypothetical protein